MELLSVQDITWPLEELVEVHYCIDDCTELIASSCTVENIGR